MTDRPSVSGEVLAELIDAAPSRVRKRLDRDPDAAKSWQWNQSDGKWTVTAGDQTVTLRLDSNGATIRSSGDVACTCLLSPKCFHLLACVSILSVAVDVVADDTPPSESNDTQSDSKFETIAPDDELVQVTPAMRKAASLVTSAVARVIGVGARSSGLVIQSSLLRSAHQCRSAGLIHLSNRVISVTEGIARLRSADDHTDTNTLCSDVIDSLILARKLSSSNTATRPDIGFNRRPFSPVDVSRLCGLFAEPILTRSGYAGVSVSLADAKGNPFYVVDLRPGDASLAKQAYRGGIDLGTTTMTAQQLCRSTLDVQGLTASHDRRLGKGTKTRWAPRKRTDEVAEFPLRFQRPIADQIQRIFSDDRTPSDDLIGFCGRVIGGDGPYVLFAIDEVKTPVRLAIGNDSDELEFRRNLQMIARCRDLPLQIIGRARRLSAGVVDALVCQPWAEADAAKDSPALVLPDSFGGRCCLGLDILQRHHVTKAERFAVDAQLSGDTVDGSVIEGGLTRTLSKRLAAIVTGGRRAIPAVDSDTHRRDRQRFVQTAQPFASEVMDALAIASSAKANESELIEMMIAADAYVEVSSAAIHQRHWEAWSQSDSMRGM